jgi:hypothetical protein
MTKRNSMEAMALEHAMDQIRYDRSQRSVDDMRADIARRNKITIQQGHLLTCGILKCDPKCARAQEK